MSRIVVFGLDNIAVGEFKAKVNRGWVLLGNTGVSDGAMTTVDVPDTVIDQPWLQPGRVVLVEDPPLPAWPGVLDTPWKATLPAQLTLYNIEYLLSLRAVERSVAVDGTVADAIREMIRLANEKQPLFIELGTSINAQTPFPYVIEQGNLWDQMIKFLEESGHEMIIRHELDARRQLHLYADVGPGLGVSTGFLLRDGPAGNMRVTDAIVNGVITNRAMGVSGESTEDDQLISDVFEDVDSQKLYRLRSEVLQFRKVTALSVLNQYVETHVNYVKHPFIDLTVEAYRSTFGYLRQGNSTIVHASEIHLPGGVQGWRGSARILAMSYDEDKDVALMTLRGRL